MSLATAELPTDLVSLRAFRGPGLSGTELKAAEFAVQHKALEIEKLKFQIAEVAPHAVRPVLGAGLIARLPSLSSGSRNWKPAWPKNATRAEAEVEAAEPAAPIRERSKPKRRPLPDHLPRPRGRASALLMTVHAPCADCGRGMAKLGEDVTEVLDYVPGHFQVIRPSCPAEILPAPRAMPSRRPRRRRCRPRAAVPRRARSHICVVSEMLRSSAALSPRARSTPARGSNSTAQRAVRLGRTGGPGCSILLWQGDPAARLRRREDPR